MPDSPRTRGRVLLLEDEPVIARVTVRTLTAEGFEVDTAANGLIAREKIAASRYDLAVFDIRTPAMNGIQLYEALELEHNDLTRRIIFTTGDSLGSATKTFLERVGTPYLPKPYTPTQLRGVVGQMMDREPASLPGGRSESPRSGEPG